MPIEWQKGYDSAITHYFPPFMKNYREKAREQGEAFFSSFDGFPGYDIVSTERRFVIKFGPYDLEGVSDLVLKDKIDGSLMVIDHKTKGASSMRKDMDLFRHQLYIYAAHVKQQYGEYPKLLAFNMIKTCELIKEEFTLEQMRKTEEWVISTIDDICMDMEYLPSVEEFHCRFLCDVRSQCENCPIYIR